MSCLAHMHGLSGFLIKLGVRLVIFTAVFFIAARKNKNVAISHRWAIPLIALVFAALNTVLYAVVQPIFNTLSFGALGLVMPLVINGGLLYGTVRIFNTRRLLGVAIDDKTRKPVAKRKPLIAITGMVAMLYLALALTLAHGVCWFALDYLPNR